MNYEDLKSAVEKALPQIGGEFMPTIADTLKEQGKQQGLQEGIQKGLQEGIQKGLQEGVLKSSREAVIEILSLRFDVVPRSIIKRLNEIEAVDILKSLHRKAVTVASLEELREILRLSLL